MVTKTELTDVTAEFNQEERRFKSIRVGDLCYEQASRGWDSDYHPAVVAGVHVEERYVDVIDVSSGGARKEYSLFLTADEMISQGFDPKDIAEDAKEYNSTIEQVKLKGIKVPNKKPSTR